VAGPAEPASPRINWLVMPSTGAWSEPIPPAVTMPKGYRYQPQGLAFFSWLYGAPSVSAGGLFSDNSTFKTVAGAVCQ
jgi:hypothetical protein